MEPGHLLPDHRQPGEQLLNPRVPLRQQLPQPRVRSAKPRSIIRHRHIGHAPHYTTTRCNPQIDQQRTNC